jgi:hypothetical protein
MLGHFDAAAGTYSFRQAQGELACPLALVEQNGR